MTPKHYKQGQVRKVKWLDLDVQVGLVDQFTPTVCHCIM